VCALLLHRVTLEDLLWYKKVVSTFWLVLYHQVLGVVQKLFLESIQECQLT